MKHMALMLVWFSAACAGDADYPTLLPTDRVLAEPVLPAHARAAAKDPAPLEAATAARAEALRARAGRLRGPVVDPALRDRVPG